MGGNPHKMKILEGVFFSRVDEVWRSFPCAEKCEIWNVGNGNEFQNKIRNICVHVRGKYKI